MRPVNFLENQTIQLTYRRMLLLFLVVVILVGVNYAFIHFRNVHLSDRIQFLNSELETMQDRQQQLLQQFDRDKVAAERKTRETLTKQFETIPSWAPLLREVAGKLPTDLWLTSIEGRRADGVGQAVLTLKGVTNHTTRLNEFMRRLDQGVYVNNPMINETRVTFVNGRAAYEFTLACEVMPL